MIITYKMKIILHPVYNQSIVIFGFSVTKETTGWHCRKVKVK